eukprot:CAMPEP_0195131322 /NCGR_PEP_ID=MMETSP0448-20130528/144755_1 /TAXON_ID=66468 /ORGANISM="Heterocapsa triquestra, Strain CCMP 448" /LENGTH=34 /DNA_ID= /DNA_START= /DNA_END= /DNA_ORIENTATION=
MAASSAGHVLLEQRRASTLHIMLQNNGNMRKTKE